MKYPVRFLLVPFGCVAATKWAGVFLVERPQSMLSSQSSASADNETTPAKVSAQN